jgi:hypothetical protein
LITITTKPERVSSELMIFKTVPVCSYKANSTRLGSVM